MEWMTVRSWRVPTGGAGRKPRLGVHSCLEVVPAVAGDLDLLFGDLGRSFGVDMKKDDEPVGPAVEDAVEAPAAANDSGTVALGTAIGVAVHLGDSVAPASLRAPNSTGRPAKR